jgi:hypothetical protein
MGFNEGKACDAVIRVLEARDGQTREGLRSPEQDGHAAPIELTCCIGKRLFAFEHTGIEPFPGHVQLQAEAKRHFRPIEAMLAGKLPPTETFELMIPVKAMQGLRMNDLQRVQRSLAAWVEATAPTLPLALYGRYVVPIQSVQPPGVPFHVSLHRWKTHIPPDRFQIVHMVTDLESARKLRIEEACARKFPKLDAWRSSKGARTVLVLEDNDIQLTNPQNVFDTLKSVERKFSNRPDEIYLVCTAIENPWYVWALRVDHRDYYTLCRADQCLTEVDANSLSDLTGHPRLKA